MIRWLIVVVLFLVIMVDSAEAAVMNDSFGIAGNYSGLLYEAGAVWTQGWGQGGYPNQNEYQLMLQYPGMQTFFTLGKLDNPGVADFNWAYTTYYSSMPAEDKQAYDGILSQVVNTRATGAKENPLASFLLIEYYVNGLNLKGMVYAITNEPDIYPQIPPDEYAQYYRAFYQRIKRIDPTAKVMVGGVTPDWLVNGDGSINQANWIAQFVNAYKTRYCQPPNQSCLGPPVDVWGIHDYPGSANPEYGIQGSWPDYKMPSGSETVDANFAKNVLTKFRNNFLPSIGQANTEVWITEFSRNSLYEGAYAHLPAPKQLCPLDMGGFNSCLTPEQQAKEDDMVIEFMNDMIPWFKVNPTIVQKWFWFVGSRGVPNWIGKLVRVSDTNLELNPVGVIYESLMPNRKRLVNKGFESSVFKDYGFSFLDGTGNQNTTSGINPQAAHTGSQGFRLTVGSGVGSWGIVAAKQRQLMETTFFNNKIIDFSVWCRGNSTNSVRLTILRVSGSTATEIASDTGASCPTAWEKRQINRFKVLALNAGDQLEFGALVTGAGASVDLDDYEIRLTGDINMDGRVDISDLRNLMNTNIGSVHNYSAAISNFGK